MRGALGHLALLTAANSGARLLGFAGLAILARVLDVEEFGTVAAALALGTAVFVVSEWGLETIYIRSAARRPNNDAAVFAAFLASRAITALVGIGAALWVGRIAGVPFLLGATVVAGYVLSSFAKSLRTPYIAAERVQIEAIIGTVERVVVFAVLVSCLYLTSPGSWIFGTAVMAGALVALGASLLALRPVWKPTMVSLRRVKAMLLASTPIGVNAIAVWTYYRASLLILSSMGGASAAGLLGAVSTITMGIGVVSQSMVPILLPRIARLGIGSESSDIILIGVQRAMMQLGVIVAAVTLVLSPLIIKLAFGPAYADAIPLLMLLSVHAFFLIVTPVLATVLRANGRQSVMLRAALAGAGASLIVAVVLVIPAGAAGAAVATLIGELVVFVMAQSAVQRALAVRVGRAYVGSMVAAGLLLVGGVCAYAVPRLSIGLAVVVLGFAASNFSVRSVKGIFRALDQERSR